MKKKALFSSILSIVLCLTMISGATFALFTDSETVNIAVTAGTVDIDVKVIDIQTKSYNKDWDGDLNFDNGGSVLYEKDQTKNELTLSLVTPGDAVKFTLEITNNSDVDIKYRTMLGLKDGLELFQGMNMYIGGETAKHDGITRVSEWERLDSAKTEDTGVVQTVEVIIEMPYLTSAEDPTNEQSKLMGKTTTMYYTVEAVQGNASEADIEAIENGVTYLYTLIDLQIFAENVNNGTPYEGKTVKLMNHIDLASIDNWQPIGRIGTSSTDFSYSFRGTFDGQDYTISNLNVANDGWAGVFGIVYKGTIKNLKVDTANLTSSRMAGVIVGQLYGSIDNCHVTNATVTVAPNAVSGGYDNGDKVGGIVGWIGDNGNNNTLKNCSVDGLTASAYRDLGGIAGYVAWSTTLENNKVANATLVGDQSVNFYGKKDYNVNAIWGRNSVSGTGVGVIDVNNTYDDQTVTIETVDVIGSIDDLKAVMTAGGEYALATDLAPTETITVPAGVTVVLDLNGKTIAGTDNTDKNFSVIDNRGTLTIKDSTGNGKMNLTASVNSGWARYSAVIANNPGGKLTIDGGIIEHLGGTDMAYGIDNLTNGKGTYAEIVINGGIIKSPYRAIRQFLNGVEAQNILTVNGGTIEGANKSIWMQDANESANTGKLTVAENAVLKGDVYLFVTADSTEWPVEASIATNALYGDSTVKSGNVPEGYVVINDGTKWFVKSGEVVSNLSGLTGNSDVYLTDGNYGMPGTSGDVTISGTKDTVITVSGTPGGSNVTFNGVTVKGSGYATGVNAATVTYNDATIIGEMCLYREKVVFNNCTFELAKGQYIWTYSAAEVEFNNCTFNTAGKAILIYNEGPNADTKVTVNNCTFNATAGDKAGAIANQNCAAIEIDSTYGDNFELVIKGENVVDSDFSGTWRIKSINTPVVVDGVEYTTIAIDGKTMTIVDKNVTVNP